MKQSVPDNNTGICFSSSDIKYKTEQKEIFPLTIDFNNIFSDDKNESCVAKIKTNQYNNFKIYNDDLLIIKIGEEFIDGKLVIVRMQGELSIKKCKKINEENYLVNAEGVFLPIKIEDYINYQIVGIISKIIHYL